MFKIKNTILAFLITCGVVFGYEIAGRVNSIDRTTGTIVIRPYPNNKVRPPTQTPDMTLTLQKDTVYRWNPYYRGLPTADINKVKRGSWVRMTYKDGKIVTVVIHSEKRDVPKN